MLCVLDARAIVSHDVRDAAKSRSKGQRKPVWEKGRDKETPETYREMIDKGNVPVVPISDGDTKPDRGSWLSVCSTEP
jgi:hypothetical protein